MSVSAQSSRPTSDSNGCSPKMPPTVFDASDSSLSAALIAPVAGTHSARRSASGSISSYDTSPRAARTLRCVLMTWTATSRAVHSSHGEADDQLSAPTPFSLAANPSAITP
jgi:hypothetical protein